MVGLVGEQFTLPDDSRRSRISIRGWITVSQPRRNESHIKIPNESTSDRQSHVLVFRVDVVKACAPMLVSQKALTHVKGMIDFPRLNLELPNLVTVLLTKSSAVHVLLPGIIAKDTPMEASKSLTLQVLPTHHSPSEHQKLTDAEVLKIHQQLGHCSEKQLESLLKFGRCKVETLQIQRIAHRCNCQRSVHRIAPPVAPRWIARFSGEVVAIDILRPFADIGPDGLFPFRRGTGRYRALLVVDSLTRFATCQLSKNLPYMEASKTFANERPRHFGKPRRIIPAQGGPLLGTKGIGGDLRPIFGWQYIRAPVRAPRQNGIAERTARSLTAAVQSIAINENRREPSQAVLAIAVIAKNHTPRAITGLPPAFAMAGRCDVSCGASTCMWGTTPLGTIR